MSIKCCVCGERETNTFSKPTQDRMEAKKLCFDCNFWDEWVQRKDDPEIARINGSHYVVGPEKDGPSLMRGHGGRGFWIQFDDGRLVKTMNLWHQGEIPEHFKPLLPNNAVFVQ